MRTQLLSALTLVIAATQIEAAKKLTVKVIKESENCTERAMVGDFLHVHYEGRLWNEEGEIFDASRKRGSTYNFELGNGQVSDHQQAFVG